MSANETMVICQVCGHENEADQRFCDECGAELQPTEASAKPVPNNAPTLDESSNLISENGQEVGGRTRCGTRGEERNGKRGTF